MNDVNINESINRILNEDEYQEIKSIQIKPLKESINKLLETIPENEGYESPKLHEEDMSNAMFKSC